MISHILFDLGNVLVALNGVQLVQALHPDWPVMELQSRFLAFDFAAAFERGEISKETFAEAAVLELGLDCTPDEFCALFVSFVEGPYTGAEAWLRSLKGRYRIGCLSNTNELHMSKLPRQEGLMRQFDDAFLSHEIGRIKPDPAAYLYVLAAWNTDAANVLFLDDNEANVVAASQVGMLAHRVFGLEEAQAVCRAVLPA